jgi:hypothetical protein
MMPDLDLVTVLAAVPIATVTTLSTVYLFSRDRERRTRALHLIKIFTRR